MRWYIVYANLPVWGGWHGGPALSAGVERVNANISQAIVKYVDFGIVRCLVLAGPGFAKEKLKEYVEAEVSRIVSF